MTTTTTTTVPTWSAAPADELPRLGVDGRSTGAPLWVARSRRERSKGLLGTDAIDGALWIPRCNWVHCFGMRYAIDVAYVARSGTVLAVAPLRPNRMGVPRLRATAVVEMAQGEAARLGVRKGVVLSQLPADGPAGTTTAAPGRGGAGGAGEAAGGGLAAGAVSAAGAAGGSHERGVGAGDPVVGRPGRPERD